MFRALLLENTGQGIAASVRELDDASLPAGDVTVAVDYSSINYKDGLVLNGLGNLVKTYPHVPGVDLAGSVLTSDSPDYKPGDKVVLTGWRVGELHWGGFAERARVKSEWLCRLPDGLSPRDAMAIGTAGLTAMLSVMDLEAAGLAPGNGPVLVTGASGGVGTFGLAILALLGYDVAASSGKPGAEDYLKSLGARTVLPRRDFEAAAKPLEKEVWAGCIDSVGGATLAKILAQMKYGGAVAAVGLVGGSKLDTTVIPFLLRGVRLIGVDSVMCPKAKRETAWKRLAEMNITGRLPIRISEIGLADTAKIGKDILAGGISGRTVVAVSR